MAEPPPAPSYSAPPPPPPSSSFDGPLVGEPIGNRASSSGLPPPPPSAASDSGFFSQRLPKSKLTAALLGIFLGTFGIHRLYLGYKTIGYVQLGLGLGGFLTCGATSVISGIWGFVEGILILLGSGITTDAQGRPLIDN
jgi:TM2 domain-containing membrane protein YozV